MVLSLLERRKKDRDYRYFKNLKDLYNISKEKYFNLLQEQKGLCANEYCKKPPGDYGKETRLHIDHNHKTGKVRGLLCVNCNHALGKVKDDKLILMGLIDYLNERNK